MGGVSRWAAVEGIGVEVLRSMCARFCGRPGCRNRAEKASRCAEHDVGPAAVTPLGENAR